MESKLAITGLAVVYFVSAGLTGSATFTDTSFTKQLDLDFDTSTFKLPRTAEGIAYMNISFGPNAQSTGDTSVYCIVKLFHFDGSTETQLGTDQRTETLTETRTADSRSRLSALQFDISQQLFAEGDLLRVTVEVSGCCVAYIKLKCT